MSDTINEEAIDLIQRLSEEELKEVVGFYEMYPEIYSDRILIFKEALALIREANGVGSL